MAEPMNGDLVTLYMVRRWLPALETTVELEVSAEIGFVLDRADAERLARGKGMGGVSDTTEQEQYLIREVRYLVRGESWYLLSNLNQPVKPPRLISERILAFHRSCSEEELEECAGVFHRN